MCDSMGNATQLMSKVGDAIDGKLMEAEQDALVRGVIGMFTPVPVVGRNIIALASKKDWVALFYAIGGYIDMSNVNQGNQVIHTSIQNDNSSRSKSTSNSSAESSSNAMQTLESQMEKTKVAIDYSDVLTQEEKIQAIEAVEDAKRAAENKDHKKLAESLGKALDIASKGAGVAKAVLEVATLVIAMTSG